MAWNPVAWLYKDEATAAKLQQMVDNDAAHDHRRDGSQGDPKRVGTIVTTTNAQGRATFTFDPPFPTGSTVIVLAVGGNDEDVWTPPEGITPTSFVAQFRSRNSAHSLIVNGAVRCNYIAERNN